MENELINNIKLININGNEKLITQGVLFDDEHTCYHDYIDFNDIIIGFMLVADNYGLGKKKDIQSLHKYSMYMMTLIAIVIYAAIYIFADPITAMFNSEQSMKLQELAVVGLRLYFTSMIVAGYNIVITVFFTSTERALPAQVLTLLRGFILIIPLSFLMSKIWEMNGIWFTFPVTELLVAVIGWVLYSRKTLN